MSRQTLILDSSRITSFFECEQKEDYEYGQSLVQINQLDPALTLQIPDKIAAGTLGHKYLEIYYYTLALTNDKLVATQTALQFDPDTADTVDPEFPLDAALRKRVRDRFKDYVINYSNRDYEVASGGESQIAVVDGVLTDVIRPIPLVERGFSYCLLDSPEYLFVLEGRIDLIAKCQNELFWLDNKWQFREHELYGKSIQFRNYALATGLTLGIINYIRLHNSIGPKTFVRQPICFMAGEISAWKEELIEIYIRITKSRQSDRKTLNRGACGGKWGTPCEFTQLCESYDPHQREILKRQNFTKKKEWRPWN